MKIAAALALSVLTLPPLAGAAQPASSYAGQEARQVKSLSPDEVRGYLKGEGLGFAKAGELNHYPGPKHVLAMADHLGLSADQRSRIGAARDNMSAAAIPIGHEIIDAERNLNARFANGTIDDAALTSLTSHIANLQGRLRAVHLAAHLATRAVLTATQIATYDQMRGYGKGAMSEGHHHGS